MDNPINSFLYECDGALPITCQCMLAIDQLD